MSGTAIAGSVLRLVIKPGHSVGVNNSIKDLALINR